MKKVLSIIIVLSLAAAVFAGCGKSGSSKSITSGKDSSSSISESAAVSQSSSSKAESKASLETMEEQECFSTDGLTVTATGISNKSALGKQVDLLVQNDSSNDYNVSCEAVIVNDCMITNMFTCSVAAGKKTNEGIILSSTDLKEAGIDEIGKIELYFSVSNSKTYKTTYNSDCVTIKTSAYDSASMSIDSSGHELYNEGGIKIVGKYVDENSLWGSSVLLYIENNSGEEVTIQADDLSVNGYMVTALFSSTVYDGKHALDKIALLSSDLEKNNIESIDTIELKFKMFDPETYKTIAETDPISFEAK